MNQTDTKATEVIAALKSGLDALVVELESAPFYQAITSPDADSHLVNHTLKHVFLSIYLYQPHVTEATFTAVGRMPKQSEQLIKDMILQQVEEVEHADMALRDYLRLGGDKALAEGEIFPECAAVAAVCHFLGEHCPPASYLGFMFIFEALTPIMATRAQTLMDRSGYKQEAREFIDLHATEDIRHTDMLIGVIEDLLRIDPTAGKSILFGFNVFKNVYPIPVWASAHQRAVADSQLIA
jgi:hypothetical protein